MAKKKSNKSKKKKGNKIAADTSVLENNVAKRVKEEKPKVSSSPSWMTWDVLLLMGLVLFVLMVRFNLLSVPFERDEGGFAYVAQQILAGQQLYTDVYEIKPPLLYVLYACLLYYAFWQFGRRDPFWIISL